jgi:hypothetical protein
MKYRKKPIVVDAVQWTLNNIEEMMSFIGEPTIWGYVKDTHELRISTLEGVMTASVGDYIIRGVKGEFYPCKPDIFEATYEPVNKSEEPAPKLFKVVRNDGRPTKYSVLVTAKNREEALTKVVELYGTDDMCIEEVTEK